jgi:class 3 adenylate cyclase
VTLQTVSVLMTDLVGSTEIAGRLGPAASEDLRREHFRLLRGAIERCGGNEVKSLGDGLMVVFSSASTALACAVEMQQAVEAQSRHSRERCDIRVGLSFGEATLDDCDYFGDPCVEAARLCAHANGGQIVVGALVRQVASTRDGHRFRTLGGLRLKGVTDPVLAYELLWEPMLADGVALPERLREIPASGYVGRVGERRKLAQLWQQASEGSLRLALIGGEAGVGKTRLSTHLAMQVHGEGATVLFGRCNEDLGVPYQPWVQALDHLVREAPRSILDWHVERHGGDLTRLVPALGERVPDCPAPREGDPETARYLLYAAAEGLLEGMSEQAPLLLILDDLHWADAPTLSLVRHVIASSIAAPVMIVGTYRDSDLSHDHPLAAVLADLHREAGVTRMKLGGLQSEDLLALIEATAGHGMGEDGERLAHELTRETAGNPFFAVELLRHLTESGAIHKEEGGRWRLVGEVAELGLPQSVREVIGRRVARLGSDARASLSAAAVIGRDFEIDLLRTVLDVEEAQLLDQLEEAMSASLLKEQGPHAGHFTFTHALVEYALYEDLGSTRRARLHRRVAEALEAQCGDDPGERLGELAGHWCAAVVSADTTKARHYARLAAERALRQLAPDEGARWYRRALDLQVHLASSERLDRCDLLIGLGEAQRQLGDPTFRETLLDAAALARELDDHDRLCRAAIANNRGWASRFGGVDTQRVETLDAAAGALPRDDPRRAQLLSLLACELEFSGDSGRCREVVTEAIEIARGSTDPATLAHVIANATSALVAPHTLAERKLMCEELSELASRLDDPRLSSRAAARGVMIGLESGDRAHAESSLVELRALAASVPEPFIGHLWLLLEFGWALLQGDLSDAERLAIRAHEVGAAAGQPDAAIFLGAHLFHIRYFQGRAGELLDQVTRLGDDQESLSGFRAGAAALALIQSGRDDEARELVLGEDLQGTPLDEAWALIMLLWADACSSLQIVDRAHELYELLLPCEGQMAVSGAHVYGSFDWALGALAATFSDHDAAERHFTAAADIDTRLDAPLLLARNHARWAGALVARGSVGDLERAHQMLEQAGRACRRLGAEGIELQVDAARQRLAAVSG